METAKTRIWDYDKSSKKYVCPKCKHTEWNRLVRFGTKELLDAEYGVCERKINCGHSNFPKREYDGYVPFFYAPNLPRRFSFDGARRL